MVYRFYKKYLPGLFVLMIFMNAYGYNHPPNVPPAPKGPSRGKVNKEYRFLFTYPSDPDNNPVSIQIYWGDDVGCWSIFVASGARSLIKYRWSTPGYYCIKYRARDIRGAKSDWSTPHMIRITNDPPYKPDSSKIQGPRRGKVGRKYTFTASTIDPNNDKIAYRFRWREAKGGGRIYKWGPWTQSGSLVSKSLSWGLPGRYRVYVQAKDIHGAKSNWTTYHFTIIIDPED